MRRYAAIAIMLSALTLQPSFAYAQIDVRTGFNADILVPDAVFADVQTFGGPEGIQRFLESKGSPLSDTSPAFVARLSEPASVALKQTLGDVRPQLGRARTAAELIWDAAQSGSLNPQVILVTLQKEQGLITGGNTTTPDRIQRALDQAMGFACPDVAGCGDLFAGFYYQLFGNVDTEGNRYLGAVRSLAKSFNTPGGRGPRLGGRDAQVGDSVTLENTVGAFGGVLARQTVTIGNKATAALYRYTPHVFNGNYNFWRFFVDWFKYPNGTLIRLPGDAALYVLQNGQRQRVPGFVSRARGLDPGTAMTLSPNEMQDYPAGPPYGPADDTIVSVAGKSYVFRDGVKHPASRFVLAQRKLDTSKVIEVDPAEAGQFADGPQLAPADGTVLRGTVIADAYLVQDGMLRRYSPFTFAQHKAAASLKYVPDDELLSYPKEGWVAPLDGTLVKAPGDPAVYLMGAGQKLPVPSELFRNLRLASKKVVTLSTDEVASYVTGVPPTPRDRTWFATAASKALYVFKDGAKHLIPAFVAKQRGITPDYVFDDGMVTQWPNGIAMPPRDNTLVKADDAATVYVVLDGQLRPLTGEIFTLRRYSFRNVVTLPSADVSVLPKAGFAPPPERTWFATTGSKDLFVFKAGEKHAISPFVAKQRGITPDYFFDDGVVDQWAGGDPIPPRDNTVVKGQGSSAYYLVSYGKLRPLSEYAASHRFASAAAKAAVLPQAEIDGYVKGAAIAK